MVKYIVATHILPWVPVYNQETDSFSLQSRKRHSALYSAINLFDSLHVGLIGSVNNLSDQLNSQQVTSIKKLYSQKKCVPVCISEKTSSLHYEGYCKKDLWPLFHYIVWEAATNGSTEASNWQNYKTVNQLIADEICKNYNEGDIIWIHDYHLLLVPQMVRVQLPNASIAFFLHTPFPTSEIFRCLPKRTEVLEGLLHSDLIGFQTYSYGRHFISSCARLLNLDSSPKGVDHNGRIVDVGVFPIGIDVERVQSIRKKPAILDKMTSIKELYAGKKIIVGRDKLDHPKSVLHLLNAFEKFLEDYPEWHNKVVLIQVTTPPQLETPKIELLISELVSRINGRFGSLEFSPINHYHHSLDEEEYFSLLSVADVGLITSLRDGMNTSCSEFVVCQQENHAPLILSEFTGTAGSLSSAILVNPWDYKLLFDHVTRHTSDFWATSFLNELQKKKSKKNKVTQEFQATSNDDTAFNDNKVVSAETNQEAIPVSCNFEDENTKKSVTPTLDKELIMQNYTKAKRRLLLFDYDGTLTPICKTPNEAIPAPNMLKALNILVKDPLNVVFVISGRDQACLDEWLGSVSGLGLSAEHGCFVKYPPVQKSGNATSEWENLVEIDNSWQPKALEIFNYYTDRTSGTFIETKKSSITWHYRLADPELGQFQAKECFAELQKQIKPFYPVEVLEGKKNVEVRPFLINKGEIVSILLKQRGEADFIFCAGDDQTDEDMFKALNVIRESSTQAVTQPNTFTCHVGKEETKTNAGFVVESPFELIDLMEKLAGF
ncbi:threalose-6-phosphate phosphatase [Clydaea vesicula]|uniref:Threalose-6-phosphate phosphatase n=1 Tax=Clydaea vesicula TaxID=447962 RepID=A0AAD5Y187_9FUNG|nr:threalose-6-phosphate phosphatase [Clydaea vesicula]